MVNSVKLKIFSVWPKIQPKTTEIIFSPYFSKNLFLLSLTRTPLSYTHCLSQSLTAPTHTPSQMERSTPTHHDRDLAGHRNCTDWHRSRSRLRSRRSRSRDWHFTQSRSRSSESAKLRSWSRRSRVKRRLRSWLTLCMIAIAILRSRSARLWSRSRRSRSRSCRSRSRRSQSRSLSRRSRSRRLRSQRDLWSFLGFIWVFRNEWHYVFVW